MRARASRGGDGTVDGLADVARDGLVFDGSAT
jgi:hypothetical protein